MTDGRAKDEVIVCEIEAGKEPPDFTCSFIQWEPEVAMAWLEADPLLKMRREFEAQEEIKKKESERDPFEGYLNPANKVFTYDEIKGKFPDGIKGD